MHVYDATQLTPLYTLGNLTRDMTDAAFSPTGEALAVLYTAGSTFASARSAVALLDATNGRELGRFDDSSLAGYGERVALASGAGRFATALFDSRSTGRIVVIDAQSGQVEHSIPITRPEDSPVTLHFLADSRLLFSAREGIALLDLSSGTTNTLSYPSVPQRVVLSADGERLAVLLVDRSIQIVSLSQGSTTALTTIEAYRNNNQPVRKIALSPAGDQLAVGLAGGVVEIWHLGEPARNDRRLATGMTEWLELWMGELALGKQALFLAWPDNYIERWNLADVTGAQEVQRLDHLARYQRAAFGPSADLLALGESSGVVRLWRVSEGRVLKTIGARGPALRALTRLAFSPDGALLAMGFETVQPDSFEVEGSISIWDVDSNRQLAEFRERDNLIAGLAFSPDSTTLAIHTRDRKESSRRAIKLWHRTDLRALRTLEQLTAPAAGPVFSADGGSLIVMHGQSVTIWGAPDWEKQDSWRVRLDEFDTPIALAPLNDNSTLIAVIGQRTLNLPGIAVLDLARQQVRRHPKALGYSIYDLAASPVTNVALAIIGARQPFLLFDPFKDERFRFVGSGDAYASARITFAPDGKSIAYADGNGIIELWGAQSPR